jgi:hypothetical protein
MEHTPSIRLITRHHSQLNIINNKIWGRNTKHTIMTPREFHLLRTVRHSHHAPTSVHAHARPRHSYGRIWKSSHLSSCTGSRLPAASICTDEAQTLPISRQFRERVYPLEYVTLIKYNELSLSLPLSLCLVTEPEGATLLTAKPAYG